jgi:hypothetical protein
VDHVERDEIRDRDRPETGDTAELLCDADVARSREIAMPTQIDQVASSGVKSTWASRAGPWNTADATVGRAKKPTQATKNA